MQLLYRLPKKKVFQLCFPSRHGLKQLLLEELCCMSVSSHLGVRKTIAELWKQAQWPHMIVYIKRVICGCHICQHIKKLNFIASRKVGTFAYTLRVFFSFRSWTFLTSLPEYARYNGVCICMDKLTKLTKLLLCYVGGRIAVCNIYS